MAKKNLYADWLRAQQGLTASKQTDLSYADLMARNEQIKNTPESALETSYAAVPRMASAVPSVPETGAAPSAWQTAMSGFSGLTDRIGNAVDTAQKGFATLYQNYRAQQESKAKEDVSKQTDAYDAWLMDNGQKTMTYADYEALRGAPQLKDQASADYYRALSNYGRRAEELGQRGISGGYSDYVDSAAYAALQNQRQAIDQGVRSGYAEYAAQQDAANRETYAKWKQGNDEAVGNLYNALVSEQDDGGYGLLGLADNEYSSVKNSIRSDLIGRGATEEQIKEAFARVEQTRKAEAERKTTLITNVLEAYANDEIEPQDLFDALGYQKKDEKEKDYDSLIYALDEGVKNGTVTPSQRETILIRGLPIYSEVNPKPKDIRDSVKAAIGFSKDDKITKKDKNNVIDRALEAVSEAARKMLNTETKIENGRVYAKWNSGWFDLGEGKIPQDFKAFRTSTPYEILSVIYNDRP